MQFRLNEQSTNYILAESKELHLLQFDKFLNSLIRQKMQLSFEGSTRWKRELL